MTPRTVVVIQLLSHAQSKYSLSLIVYISRILGQYSLIFYRVKNEKYCLPRSLGSSFCIRWPILLCAHQRELYSGIKYFFISEVSYFRIIWNDIPKDVPEKELNSDSEYKGLMDRLGTVSGSKASIGQEKFGAFFVFSLEFFNVSSTRKQITPNLKTTEIIQICLTSNVTLLNGLIWSEIIIPD